MSSILVTGINGFLGSHLAKSLSVDHTVIGLEYQTGNLFRLTDFDFKVYSFAEQELELLFLENNFDVIIHTATNYRRNNESLENVIKTNILLPIKLYELAITYKVPYFINTDSFFNNQSYSYNYLGEYTLSKRHLIEWLKVIQKETVIVNMKIFHMYGPGDSPAKFVTWIIKELIDNVPEIKLTSGEQERDFIYIDDVVNAFLIVINNLSRLKNKFNEFEVGTGYLNSISQFVTLAAQLTNSNSKLLFGSLPLREGEIKGKSAVADNKPLLSLGWNFNTSLSDGINKTINATIRID